MNPLKDFENTFLKECRVLGKKFVFNTSENIKSLNKVDILIDCLVSVNDVPLVNFDTISDKVSKGLDLKEAKREEIESWEPEIIDILVKKYINIIKDKKPIDFKNLPDLRIYWKLRKIFSEEELNNFSRISWEWAIWNIQEDLKEDEEFDERALERRKPWYSIELFNHLNKKEQEKQQQEQENKLLIQKMMEEQGVNPNNFEIELVDEELPSIIEETDNALNEDK